MAGTRAIDAIPMIVARLFQNSPPGITRRPSLPDSADGARARNSAGVLTANGRRRTPTRAAAISALGISETDIASFGFANTATPRGRAMLVTNPAPSLQTGRSQRLLRAREGRLFASRKFFKQFEPFSADAVF